MKIEPNYGPCMHAEIISYFEDMNVADFYEIFESFDENKKQEILAGFTAQMFGVKREDVNFQPMKESKG